VKLPKPAEAPLARSFAAFTALIKLELFFDCALESDCIQFYMYLGSSYDSYPNLKHLRLDKFSFERKQKLALVLGHNAQLVHQSVIKKLRGPNGNMHRLLFPKELVSPMCRSLESFVVWDNNSRRNSHDRNFSIFLLRHFPRLQILHLNFYELNAAI